MSAGSPIGTDGSNFRCARAFIFPDGTLTPEGKEAVKQKPDAMAEVFEEQNKRIAELMAQVKLLDEQNKKAREDVKKITVPVETFMNL